LGHKHPCCWFSKQSPCWRLTIPPELLGNCMSLLFGTAESAGYWSVSLLPVSVDEFCVVYAILNVGP
jgi:hypothetical protein